MPRIKCASMDCKWNDDSGYCTFGSTHKTLLLDDCSVSTVNQGRQHYHRCNGYEQTQEAKELEKMLTEIIAERFSK